MKRIFTQTIFTGTILGMTIVPVFGAAGMVPVRMLVNPPVSSNMGDLYGLIHRIQDSNGGGSLGDGPVGGESVSINEGFEGGEYGYGGSRDEDTSESDQRFAAVANDANARRLVKLLEGGEEYCKLLDAPSRIDCFADSLASAARSLSNEGDEGIVKRAINDAVEKLDRIVEQNIDRTANLTRPQVKTNRQITKQASRPLRKVAPARQATANAQASAVIDELSTVLLRSAENSSKRKNYYAKIAQAVDSNKVLLRST